MICINDLKILTNTDNARRLIRIWHLGWHRRKSVRLSSLCSQAMEIRVGLHPDLRRFAPIVFHFLFYHTGHLPLLSNTDFLVNT